MKHKLLLIILTITLLTGLCACGDEETADSGLRKTKAGTSIKVDESTGAMKIRRPQIKDPAPMGEKDTWTIFVYLCGSDLESRLLFGGAGSSDIKEMCKATASDKVRFVIETGGANYWHNSKIDSDVIGRFVIEKGKLKAAGTKKKASMGKSGTLASFLTWGVGKYPAEKMGLILWDHGGGSLAGVCFDELANDDSLSLREIDAALLSTLESGKLTDKFEFIGFDACLMSTLETANVAASYADYMVASEESEPGSGWDYTAIGNYLAKNPAATGEDLGRRVCDSFQKQCEKSGDGKIATLSVIDLSRVDGFLKKFNTFAREMYKKSEKKKNLTDMARKITSVDNFGGNNKSEGYTNMVDLGGLIGACKSWSPAADDARKSLHKAVLYKIAGADHKAASGLSVYYPLSGLTSEQMGVFQSVCPSPYYLSFLGRQGYASANDGDTEGYDEEEIFEDGGIWSFLNTFLFDEETGDYQYDEDTGSDWAYCDEAPAESNLITFAEGPGIGEDGQYCFVLDDSGYENTADVLALVYQHQKDGTYLELGETYDVEVDWEEGYVADSFDGYWLSLPDGQNLATYIVEVTDKYVIYSAPILLNGEETCLRMRQYLKDGKVKVDGCWSGIDESGAADKAIVKLHKGDTITPTYYSIDEKGNDQAEYEGEPCKLKKADPGIRYDLMYPGDYAYAFCVTDIYGSDYVTDSVDFHLSKKGNVSFYE